jgi:small conductance mechanosensitive channel
MLTLALQEAQEQAASSDSNGWADMARDMIVTYGPRVLAALVILVVGWIVARAITSIAGRGMGRAHLDKTLARFLTNLVFMLLMTFVVLAAISKLGVETASFIAVIGAAGFSIGFALQGSLSNFAAGVMILIFRPFKTGDAIEAGGTAGEVADVGIFSTVLLTPDNKRVIVANSAITGGNITNYSAMPTRRVDMQFAVSYGDDLRVAKQILERLMASDARVLKEPACVIAVGSLGDSSVNIVCRPWVKSADYWPVHFDTHEQVKLAFEAGGITIPCPRREVRMHQVA